MFYGNAIFVGCILYFDNHFLLICNAFEFHNFYTTSYFISWLCNMQIHSLYGHKKNDIHLYLLCHATSLPNVIQHDLPNLDVLPQCATLGSTSSIVRTLRSLNTGVPGVMSMEVDMGHDVLRICLTTDYAFQVFHLSLMIFLSFVDLFVK